MCASFPYYTRKDGQSCSLQIQLHHKMVAPLMLLVSNWAMEIWELELDNPAVTSCARWEICVSEQLLLLLFCEKYLNNYLGSIFLKLS
jgi:hypothetical protein